MIYALNLARPGREQQESNYIIDTLQVYDYKLRFLFFSRKNTYYYVFITRLDGKLLIRNFHYKIESSSGKKYRGLI